MVFVAKDMPRRGIQLPLLIGGATTSRHMAVRVSTTPSTRSLRHVLWRRRSAPSDDRRPAFEETNRGLQETLRFSTASARKSC